MTPPLVRAHIEAQARLRGLTEKAVRQIWKDLRAYNRSDIPEWLAQVLPVVQTSQRASVNLTNAFLARQMGRQPLAVNPEKLIGSGVRNGTPPAAVYARPFVNLWSALGAGTPFAEASNAALARATSSAAMDVQLSMRATADAVGQADEGIYGYQRVADGGACEFCQLVDGAYVKDGGAMALHNNCGCGLEPLTAPHPRAVNLPSGVAIHEHGELGPLLGAAGHDFTSAADIPAL